MADLRKFFNKLRRFNLKLNPAKCAFAVPVGKLLGFIVSRRGIELDPTKVNAIQKLPPPKNKKDKDAATKWTDDYQKAFDRIKEYLSMPPVLVPPKPGRPLLLYLAVSDRPFGCVLGQHDETGRNEKVIYYLREDIAESYDGWRLFFDGAANLKGVGIGAVLVSETGQHYPVSAKLRYDKGASKQAYSTRSPWPFAAWGMDVIGTIELAASNGHRFILVAIDYFTKWVEATSYRVVTKKVVAGFVHDRIVCQFGVTESIITDNGSNLNSDLMKAMCETFKIKHKNSTGLR
ncbi:uncharacterized protein [Nicotiana sylvestris]|uniref:uncharacterized protein n=1 Tax=Nicotiana sylvestris TaxID=4096 RepID=UPI00388C5827